MSSSHIVIVVGGRLFNLAAPFLNKIRKVHNVQ